MPNLFDHMLDRSVPHVTTTEGMIGGYSGLPEHDGDLFGYDDELGAVIKLAVAPVVLSARQRHDMIQSFPYMKLAVLNTIVNSRFRVRKVKNAALAELNRRQRGGKRLAHPAAAVAPVVQTTVRQSLPARRENRRATHMARVTRRGRFGDDIPAGFELKPKLGSALLAHPFKALALAIGALGVGMAVKGPTLDGVAVVTRKVRSRF